MLESEVSGAFDVIAMKNKASAKLKLGILFERKSRFFFRFFLSKTRCVTRDAAIGYVTVPNYFQKIVQPIF